MLFDFINISSDEKAMYLQIEEQIKSALKKGVIKYGDRLPSIREAAKQLSVSCTTIENAYLKLCIEGVIESYPQRGYYICLGKKQSTINIIPKVKQSNIIYDFSTRGIDYDTSDAELWKKILRSVLRQSQELTTYGDVQGEPILRKALAEYSYKARGVICNPEQIVIGAGFGPLLNILCGLIGNDVNVGIENGSFEQAQQIFTDYKIKTSVIECDQNGAKPEILNKDGSDILMLLPSALSKISITGLSKRRNTFVNWAYEKEERYIIEDDYNGELRFNARSLTSFQNKCPEKTVYIGSFSKLLLPSVRIAYMVLPNDLWQKYLKRKFYYNQTCGKIEQLTLEKYISTGALEKHLKKLRNIYSVKSRIIYSSIKKYFPKSTFTLYETSLIIKINTKSKLSGNEIYKRAENEGIRLIYTQNTGEIKLCFSSIKTDSICYAIEKLSKLYN